MNILITGGTGFIGKDLVKHLEKKKHKITILTRDKSNAQGRAVEDLAEIPANEKIDVIINLAGAKIAKYWTEKYKQELINSRINTTKNIITLIERLKTKPKLLLNASAIGYYGAHGDEILYEDAKTKNEFTHILCKKWEDEANKASKYGVRVCITRLGVVLGKNGGALKQMLPSFKMGLGGKLGSGQQYFSWVAKEDVITAFDFLISDKKLQGVFNLTAPNPVSNEEFTKALGKALNRPTIFTMPSFVIKTLFGEMGEELLLKGQRVIPKRLLDSGFKFKYEKIDQALKKPI